MREFFPLKDLNSIKRLFEHELQKCSSSSPLLSAATIDSTDLESSSPNLAALSIILGLIENQLTNPLHLVIQSSSASSDKDNNSSKSRKSPQLEISPVHTPNSNQEPESVAGLLPKFLLTSENQNGIRTSGHPNQLDQPELSILDEKENFLLPHPISYSRFVSFLIMMSEG